MYRPQASPTPTAATAAPRAGATTHVANFWPKRKHTEIVEHSAPVVSEGYSLSVEHDGAGPELLEPVEVLDCGVPVPPECGPCQSEYDGSICDGVYRSKGCDRIPCPCPTDEVLSYYRCNFYGHYPTFWRPWPGGFLKYRPEVHQTMYDRFRKPQPGQAMDPGVPGTESMQPPQSDLDRELQELMRESQVPRNSSEQRQPPPPLDVEDLDRPRLPGSTPAPPQQPDRELTPPPTLPDQSRVGPLRSLGRFFAPQQYDSASRRRASRRL